MKKTKPKRAARAPQSKALIAAADATPPIKELAEAVHVWNTLGVASALATTPARVMRALANGEIKSTVRIVGGDGRPRFAFCLGDVYSYAKILRSSQPRTETGKASAAFIDANAEVMMDR